MRALFGFFASAINVPIYTLIAREFKPEFRATANSFDCAGYYFGGGIASFLTIIIKKYGWRAMYQAQSLMGITLGLLIAFFVKNPERKRKDATVAAVEPEEVEVK